MKTSIKTLTEFKEKIYNTFSTNYHNGFIEGNNNFIKVLKRIAFGFRSFTRFKARIMICKGLINPKEKEAEKQRKIENKKRRETLMKMRIDKIRKENQANKK